MATGFDSPVNLTESLSTNHWTMAVDVSNPQTVHFAYRNSGTVRYRKSTDAGKTWSAFATIVASGVTEVPLNEAICADGNFVHLLYDAGGTLKYLRSTDGGANWASPVDFWTGNAGFNYRLTIVTDAGEVHAVWTPGGSESLRYQRSTDNGANWSATANLYSAGAVVPGRPYMAIKDGLLLFVWSDMRYGDEAYSGSPGETMLGRSLDRGVTWETEQRLSFTDDPPLGGTTSRANVCMDGRRVNVWWQDPGAAPGPEDMYHVHSNDGGKTFGAPTVFASDNASQEHLYAAQKGDHAIAIWADMRVGGIFKLWMRYSTDGGKTWDSEQPVLTTANQQHVAHIGILDRGFIVTFQDSVTGIWQVRRGITPLPVLGGNRRGGR